MTTNEYLYDTEETNRIRELAMGRVCEPPAPFFADSRRGLVLALVGAIIAAATEPAVPALLKVLLDDGMKQSAFPLWVVPIAVVWSSNVRRRSKRAGSANCAGSRLAEPRATRTCAPASRSTSASSVGAVVSRMAYCTGASQRNDSSMARSIAARSARAAPRASTSASSAKSVLPISR